MLGPRAGQRAHLCPLEHQVAWLIKLSGMTSARLIRCCVRIAATVDSIAAGSMEAGSFSGQAQDDSAVCGMADSGEGQRTVQLGLNTGNAVKQTVRFEVAWKSASCAHRSHGVGT